MCHVCGKKYSRNDRLKAHLELAHDIRVSKQVNRFLCPFKCDQPAFRTMSVLLGHCEQHHESSLGKSNTRYMIISGYYSINGNLQEKSNYALVPWTSSNDGKNKKKKIHIQRTSENSKLTSPKHQIVKEN